MTAPEPLNVLRHQLDFAKAEIMRARAEPGGGSSHANSALLSLHTAIEALAEIVTPDSQAKYESSDSPTDAG